MKKVEVTLNEDEASVWSQLPKVCQDLVAEKAVQAILNGDLYPTGTEQLELAITLAEYGVDPQLVSRITRLDTSVFEAFYNSSKTN